jgi:hypothetical protein
VLPAAGNCDSTGLVWFATAEGGAATLVLFNNGDDEGFMLV